MRKPPEIEVPPVAPQDNQKYIKEVRRYKVITPLFGGGVEPGTADPITIVRATEVRGSSFRSSKTSCCSSCTIIFKTNSVT